VLGRLSVRPNREPGARFHGTLAGRAAPVTVVVNASLDV
jgi:hypothetical protein